jgi:hypothetical protein
MLVRVRRALADGISGHISFVIRWLVLFLLLLFLLLLLRRPRIPPSGLQRAL